MRGQPAGRRTQEARRAEAEGRLVTAAAEIIADAGPAALTLASVGERAGYSRGLASHHFGSKAALVQRVADVVTAQFRAAVPAVVSGGGDAPVVDELLALVEVYLGVVISPGPEHRARLVLIADAVARPEGEGRSVIVAASEAFRGEILDRLEVAIRAGELPPDLDAGAFAVTVTGLLRGVAFESMLDPTIDLQAVRREIVALFTARLDPPARGPEPR